MAGEHAIQFPTSLDVCVLEFEDSEDVLSRFRLGFSEGPTWPSTSEETDDLSSLSYNKRNIMKWEKDEPLGDLATISPVLYCNVQHPELKTNYPGQSLRHRTFAQTRRTENRQRGGGSENQFLSLFICRVE